jgi:transposase
MQDEVRFSVLKEFLAGRVSRAEAAKALGITERAVTKAARKVREHGLRGAIHGNRGRKPVNKLDELSRLRILKLKKEKYYDFSVLHAHEKLLEKENISVSYSSLYRMCKQTGLMKFKQKRRGKPRTLRERYAQEGYFLQMDGSPHNWFGEEKTCLIAMIDDATSDIPAAEFWPTETTAGCLAVLCELIEKRGKPWFLFTDKAGVYGGQKRQEFSHFDQACKELGISVIYADSAEAKGRVERLFRTFQDRFVAELRLAGITNIADANAFLKKYIEQEWSKKFTVQAADPVVAYRQVEAHEDFKQICSIRIQREIKRDSSISFQNVIYVLSPKKGDPILASTLAEIRIYPNNSWAVYAEGRRMNLNVAPGNRQPDPNYRHKIRPGNPDLSYEYANSRKAS